MGLRAVLDRYGKSRPTGIRSPDRPARSQSLYRLRHLAHSHDRGAETILPLQTVKVLTEKSGRIEGKLSEEKIQDCSLYNSNFQVVINFK